MASSRNERKKRARQRWAAAVEETEESKPIGFGVLGARALVVAWGHRPPCDPTIGSYRRMHWIDPHSYKEKRAKTQQEAESP